ncbi:MAG: DUF4375 domain-containing protein [Bacteroidetes bacterium]|nr:DUF4375 domain-containing protein [Bacteroidota bacterium]
MDKTLLREQILQKEWVRAFDLLAAPLQTALWEMGSFEGFLKIISPIERLVICFDYFRSNLIQGGYIQVFQNGYAPLLMWAIQSAQELEFESEIWQSLDAALKVYVLNNEMLSKEYSVEEFARLYVKFPEFELLETSYKLLEPMGLQEILNRALSE